MLKEALFKLHETVEPLIFELEAPKDNNVALTMMALYATIVELTHSAIFLLNAGKYGGVESIQRSVYEAYVDLVNLNRDAKYINKLLLEYYQDKIDIGKQALSGNRWLADMNTKETAARVEGLRKQFDALMVTDGPRIWKIEDRFKLAGMQDQYTTVYKSLCGESHNNLAALTDRHLRESADDAELVIFAPRDKEHHDHVYDSFAGILDDSTLMMHTRFGSPVLYKVKAASKRLREVRDAYMAQA